MSGVSLLAQSTTVQANAQVASRPTTREKENQLLERYKLLFGTDKEKTCEETELPLTPALDYSLHICLHKSDPQWALAIVGINDFDDLIKQLGNHVANKMKQVGIVVRKFCENDPRKLKGFRCSDLMINNNNEYKSDLFALLVFSNDLNIGRYAQNLMAKITQQTDLSASIGITRMNIKDKGEKEETFEEWKQRALENLKKAQNEVNGTVSIEAAVTQQKRATNRYYKDSVVEETDAKVSENENGNNMVSNLRSKDDFDAKMQEMGNLEQYDWLVAIIEIDDFESFVFANDNKTELISKEMIKIENEMYHLFDIYGNENELKYFGYTLTSNYHASKYSGKFAMILWDSEDRNKCFVPAYVIIETFKDEIGSKCPFTVSIGCSRLDDDDLGMPDDWQKRIENNLKQAQKNGGNQVCFGSGDDHNDEYGIVGIYRSNSLNINQDDEITKKSLQMIEVHACARGLVLFFCFSFFVLCFFCAACALGLVLYMLFFVLHHKLIPRNVLSKTFLFCCFVVLLFCLVCT